MNGYESYKMYKAIGLHFTSPKYDYFKYHGKTNITPNAWNRRSDKYHFEKLGYQRKTDEVIAILVSYYCQKPNLNHPIGTDISEHVVNGYPKWKGKLNQLERIFEEDLYYMKNYAHKNCKDFKSLFQIINNQQHPIFLSFITGNKISYESAIIFDMFTNVFSKMDQRLKDDLVWDEYREFLYKYSKFLKVNEKKYKKIIKKVLKND